VDGKAVTTHLLMVLGLEFDCNYLPHQARWWHDRGIDQVHITFHSRKPRSLPDLSEWKQPVTTALWIGTFYSGTKVAHLEKMRRQYVTKDDLYVVVDADEFPAISNVTACWKKQGRCAPVMYGNNVDRFAKKPGVLGKLNPDGNILEQFPVSCPGWSQSVLGMTTSKALLFCGNVVYKGIHQNRFHSRDSYQIAGGKIARIWHCKWVKQRRAKARARIRDWQNTKKTGHGHWKKSRKLLKYIRRKERHNGN